MNKKKVVITGGSGDIAKAIGRVLKTEYMVYLPHRSELDVTGSVAVKDYMQRVNPDILINNAGFIEPVSILNQSEDILEEHFRINVYGAFYCSRYALRNGCSLIINIGSSAGRKGKKDWSAYCASKAALIRFTESLYAEGHPAVCISPGRTHTKMRSRLVSSEDPNSLLDPMDLAKVVFNIIRYPILFYGKNIGVRQSVDGVVCMIDKEVETECIRLL